jgi:hypothetical protein
VTVRPGEVVKDGRNITVGAPLIEARAHGQQEQTPSQVLGTMLRHLKGVLAAAQELQAVLEEQERKE